MAMLIKMTTTMTVMGSDRNDGSDYLSGHDDEDDDEDGNGW